MKSFADIYSTLGLNAEPQPRSIYDLGILLRKAYELAEHSFFSSCEIFTVIDDTPLALHRTTVQQMLLEIERLTGAKSFAVVTSQGVEILILHLYVIDEYVKQLPGADDHYYRLVFGGQLKAILRSLTDSAREGIVGTIRLNILQALSKIDSPENKVRYLKKLLLSYRQHKNFTDPKQYSSLSGFVQMEQERHELDIDHTIKSDMSKNSHSISVGPGGIANVSYGAGATQTANTGHGAVLAANSGDAAQLNTAGHDAAQSLAPAQADSLREWVELVRQALVQDNVFDARREEMEQELDRMAAQLGKAEPKKSLLARAVESLQELAAGATGTAAGHAVYELLKQAPALLAAVN